jgi:hypothetical protein
VGKVRAMEQEAARMEAAGYKPNSR